MNGPLVQHVVNNKMLNGEVIRIDGALRMMPQLMQILYENINFVAPFKGQLETATDKYGRFETISNKLSSIK